MFRHIILIRHGQYNLNGNGDKEKYLTELGREQVTGAIPDIISLGIWLKKYPQSSVVEPEPEPEP
jgi:serine/threonine-protein phosphatase PGAM5